LLRFARNDEEGGSRNDEGVVLNDPSAIKYSGNICEVRKK